MSDDVSLVWGENGTLLILIAPGGIQADKEVHLAWEHGILSVRQGERVLVRADFSADSEVGDLNMVFEAAQEVIVVEVGDNAYIAHEKVLWDKGLR